MFLEDQKTPSAHWTKHREVSLDVDCFSSGQVLSKIWLLEVLEELLADSPNPLRIVCYASWYGMTPFLLMSRGKIPVQHICCFDHNDDNSKKALVLNEAFVSRGLLSSRSADINQLSYGDLQTLMGGKPDLIINTSAEHLDRDSWFDKLPNGQLVAIQGCDMKIQDHNRRVHSEQELIDRFPLTSIDFIGTKMFRYPDWGFNRYMLIGKK